MPLWQLQAPTAIALQLGAFSIRWYGVCLALGILSAYWLVERLRRKRGQTMAAIESLLFVVVIVGIIGGRLLHVVLEWSYYSTHLWQIPQIWLGGLAIHGAIIAGALALYLMSRRQQERFLPLLDQLIPGLALAQAIGRWGNYFNQELYGQPTNSFFGIYIEPQFRISNFQPFSLFHPIFLYESLGLLVLCFILLSMQNRILTPNSPSRVEERQRVEAGKLPTPKSQHPGLTTAFYLIGYGLVRFSIGYLRIDPQLSFWGLRFDQWESVVFVVGGLLLIWKSQKRPDSISELKSKS